MSHEVDIHPAQTIILRELLFHPSASFTDLQKPTELDSAHFKFHIARLVQLGFIQKEIDSNYSLTTLGKEYANRLDTDKNTIEKQPKLSVLLAIEKGDGRLLFQQRLKQPFYGFWSLPTGKISWGEEVTEAGARELKEETGLVADLRVSGLQHKIDRKKGTEDLLEDKFFTVIHGTNPTGELITDMEGHHNERLSIDEVLQKEKVFRSSMEKIISLARGQGFGFLEGTHYYDSQDY